MRRYLLLAIRIVGCLLIAVITMELCARLDDKLRFGAPFWGDYSLNSLFVYDAAGMHGKPNVSYLKWKLNEDGYRGPALRAGTYRIITMGASETFGIFESEDKEWPRQLEQILNASSGDGHYEVVNTAYHATSVADNLHWLDRGMDQLKPQMVVVYPNYASYIDPKRVHGLADVRPESESFSHWRIATRVRNILKDNVPASLQDYLRKYQLRNAVKRAPPMDRVPEECVARFQHDLDALVSAIQARGAKVILVTHATRFGSKVLPEDQRFLMMWARFYPILREDGFLDMEARMSDAVREVGARHSVPVVDAARQLSGGKNFAEMVHFTDAGAHALAALIAPVVEQDAQSLASEGPEQGPQHRRGAQ